MESIRLSVSICQKQKPPDDSEGSYIMTISISNTTSSIHIPGVKPQADSIAIGTVVTCYAYSFRLSDDKFIQWFLQLQGLCWIF